MASQTSRDRVRTGIDNADTVLHGGLLPESATLVRGSPGAGKTIFGLHFLAADLGDDADRLYINLGEPSSYLQDTASSFGIDIDAVEFLDLSPSASEFEGDSTYEIFHPDEVESSSLVEGIRERVEAVEPDRVLIDPVTELRYLTRDDHQFRSQVLALIDYLKDQGATVVLTSQAAPSIPDDDLQFLVDGVVNLGIDADRRTLEVTKFRGSGAMRGRHTVTISDDGLSVWPRLDPDRDGRKQTLATLPSGVPELDKLLNGGLTSGTITFFSGPTGVGKTTTGLHFMKEAAGRDKRSVVYSFEEGRRTMIERAAAVNIPVQSMIDSGKLVVEEIAPDQLSMDEFTSKIVTEVEEEGTEIVMIDGVTGYERALRGTADDPARDLIKIGRYLRNMDVTGIITNEVHQITGEFRATEQNVSHLADSIVILRHVEYKGELRKVIGVLKMRTSDFEKGLRTLQITEYGLTVGEPLSEMRGILTGTPEWTSGE